MYHREIRQKIIDMCLQMNSSGLNQGTSGNISVRHKDYMIITPSGVPYEDLSPGDLCQMSLRHNRYEWKGDYKPSSEWNFHRAVLQSNEEFGAVIHTHSTYATVLSIGRETIPPCHYMIAAFGGNTVRCADYATFGTDELTRNILVAMKDRSACLMANHGMLTVGANLDKAMWAAVELETLSKQFYLAKKADSMVLLSDREMDEVHEGFRNYGSKAQEQHSTEETRVDQATAESRTSPNRVNGTPNKSASRRAANKKPLINLPAKTLQAGRGASAD